MNFVVVFLWHAKTLIHFSLVVFWFAFLKFAHEIHIFAGVWLNKGRRIDRNLLLPFSFFPLNNRRAEWFRSRNCILFHRQIRSLCECLWADDLFYFISFGSYIIRLVGEKTEERRKEKEILSVFAENESTTDFFDWTEVLSWKSETWNFILFYFLRFPIFSLQPIVNCSKYLFCAKFQYWVVVFPLVSAETTSHRFCTLKNSLWYFSLKKLNVLTGFLISNP